MVNTKHRTTLKYTKTYLKNQKQVMKAVGNYFKRKIHLILASHYLKYQLIKAPCKHARCSYQRLTLKSLKLMIKYY